MSASTLTVERLRKLLHYDPVTGVFRWKVQQSGLKRGSTAEVIHQQQKYWNIQIDGRTYRAHRLAWFYVHGWWPTEQIDHKNGVRDDNRFDNLREASQANNSHNAKRFSTNTSGFKGVSWHSKVQKWQTRICINGRCTHLGYFHTPIVAHAAYRAAAIKYRGEFARFE